MFLVYWTNAGLLVSELVSLIFQVFVFWMTSRAKTFFDSKTHQSIYWLQHSEQGPGARLPAFPSFPTLSKSPNLSVCQFSPLKSRASNSTYLLKLNELLIHGKNWEQYLAHNKYSVNVGYLFSTEHGEKQHTGPDTGMNRKRWIKERIIEWLLGGKEGGLLSRQRRARPSRWYKWRYRMMKRVSGGL